MSDETKKPESNVESTISAAAEIVKAIPVYQDVIQPSAKQLGRALETVTKTVNIALAPIKALVWGFEQIEDFVTNRVSEKLKNVPEENIVTPLPQIAGPAVEALRYLGHDENLRELFANLLATSMDKNTLDKAHPGYVDIIKNITADEAVLLTAFINKNIYPKINIKSETKDSDKVWKLMKVNFSHLDKIVSPKRPDLIPAYIDNLQRLGLIENLPNIELRDRPEIYEPLENDPQLDSLKKEITEKMNRAIVFDRGILRITSFGRQFVNNVIVEKA